MGHTTIESLKGKKAGELYAEECALRGYTIDRCQLYLYRAVEYFVNTKNPDPMKCWRYSKPRRSDTWKTFSPAAIKALRIIKQEYAK